MMDPNRGIELNTVPQHVITQGTGLRLSAETPVYDLLGLRPFQDKIVTNVVNRPSGIAVDDFLGPLYSPSERLRFPGNPDSVTDIYVGGRAGAGKQLIAENLIYKLLHDPFYASRISKFEERWGRKLWIQFYNTPMANFEGMLNGEIKHPIGCFDINDIDGSNRTMSRRLSESYENSPRPLIRVIETLLIGWPTWPYGATALTEAIENSKRDPNHAVFVVASCPTIPLQDHALNVRTQISQAKTPEEAERRMEESGLGVKFADKSLPEVWDYINYSWGNQRARKLVDEHADRFLVENQAAIRALVNPTLPEIDIEDLRGKTGLIRPRYDEAGFHYMLRFYFPVSGERRHVRINRKLQNFEIPLYRGISEQFGLVRIEPHLLEGRF